MKKFINKYKKIIVLALINIIILILGLFTIKLIPALIVLLVFDIIYFFINKPKKSKKKTSALEIFKTILIFGFSCCIILLITAVCGAIYIVVTAPKFSEEKLYNKDATILYLSNGEEVAKIGDEMRQTVKYEDLSQSLIDAIIATEDSRFFQHSGVDLPRFLKASFSQILGQGGGGASTLTMQVSKNAFTSTKDEGLAGIIRKFTDIYVSVFEIERHYTKEQILTFYVNYNNLGSSNRGVEQASQDYFGKSASELNVAEAAMIAGMFQAPNNYYPFTHPEECEQRRQEVLNLMLRHGYITTSEYEIAKSLTVDKLIVEKEEVEETNEYDDFINTVVEEVIERTGMDPYSVPMKIYTTMDKDMQALMSGVMNGTLYEWENDDVQGASIIIDVNNGEIKAVGGGRNRVAKGVNYATGVTRQIGSTAKPLYDYGPGIEYNNWSTYTPFVDEPYAYSDGTPLKNWNNTFDGLLTLHDSLKYSRNIPAVKAFQSVDNAKIKEFVTNLGLSPDVSGNGKINESHALGGYEGETPMSLAAAYAAISNGGYYYEPHSFTKIEFIESGEVYEVKPITKRAMSESTAYMLTKILEDTSSYAIGRNVNGVNYAGKSGTNNLPANIIDEYGYPSNAIKDKWIASFNDSYAITVWYGYEELTEEHCVTVNNYNIKDLFQTIAEVAYTEKSDWGKPEDHGVVELEVESGLPTAMLASEFTPESQKVTAYFKKGFEPTETSTRFSHLANVTNLNYDTNTSTLSWDPIATPNFIDNDYITKLFTPLYTDKEKLQEAIDERINYNTKNIGTVVYDVYIKDDNENLKLITTTSNNQFTYPITETTTFVVKTAYSIFKDNISSGIEFTVQNISSSIISSEINGDYTVILSVGDRYVEPEKPVIVLENGINDVTALATILSTVMRNSDGQVYNSTSYINTSVPETYTITYHIQYGNYTNTLTKIVQIQ